MTSRVFWRTRPRAAKSGVGVVSGWGCEADELEISFDGGVPQFVPYGSEFAFVLFNEGSRGRFLASAHEIRVESLRAGLPRVVRRPIFFGSHGVRRG